ncbi:MAG: hypothetical protein K0R54_1810 [Clostridiaceae bacterium]|jgi:hypothetical protein|nr:hypothetical protein [Clostridiaceae bacterium]
MKNLDSIVNHGFYFMLNCQKITIDFILNHKNDNITLKEEKTSNNINIYINLNDEIEIIEHCNISKFTYGEIIANKNANLDNIADCISFLQNYNKRAENKELFKQIILNVLSTDTKYVGTIGTNKNNLTVEILDNKLHIKLLF